VPLCSIIRVEPLSSSADGAENSGNGQTAYQKLVRIYIAAVAARIRSLKRTVGEEGNTGAAATEEEVRVVHAVRFAFRAAGGRVVQGRPHHPPRLWLLYRCSQAGTLSHTHSWSAARACVHISSVTLQFVDAVRTHAPASVTGLFAFAYRPPKEEKYSNRLQLTTFTCDVITNRPTRKRYTEDKGWGVYDVIKEYNRIGIPSK
jgi:hypothetical protein